MAESTEHRNARSLIETGGITLIGALVGAALTLANEILLARILGVESYGLYSLGFTMAKIGETLAVFGLRLSVLRFIPLYAEEKRDDLVLGTVFASLLLPLTLGLGLGTLLWLTAPFVANVVFTEPQALPFIRLFAFAIVVLALSEVVGVIGRAFNKPAYYVLVRNLVPQIAFTLLLVPRALDLSWIERPWTPIAYDLAYLLGTLVGLYLLVRLLRPMLRQTVPTMPYGALYGYSATVLLNILFYMCLGWTDIVILGIYGTTAEVGIYRACIQAIIVFDLVWNGFAVANAHVFPRLLQPEQKAHLQDAYTTTTRWTAALCVPLFVVFAFEGSDFLWLLGPDFVAGAVPLAVLGVAALLRVTCSTAALLLIISGRQTVETANGGITAVVNLLLCLILIPEYGMLGAAAATALSMLGISIARIIETKAFLGIRTDFGRPVALLGLSMLFAWLVTSVYWSDADNVALRVAHCAVTIAGCAVLSLLVGLSTRDRRILLDLAARLRGRAVPAGEA